MTHLNLESCLTEINRLPPNCTLLAQSLDQLVFRAFKAEWKRRWYMKRNELVRKGEFTTSRRVRNPGNNFLLEISYIVASTVKTSSFAGIVRVFNLQSSAKITYCNK